MRYAEYDAWFTEQYAQITIEPDWKEAGPYLGPTSVKGGSCPWQLEWCILFPDNKHLVVRDNWRTTKGNPQIGQRSDFSFHYGSSHPSRDANSIPLRDNINYPPVIRIDRDWKGPHIHYKMEDHIPQTRVKNLDIVHYSLFDFVRAVLEHRRTGRDIDAVIGFEVI